MLADAAVGNAHDMIERSTRVGLYAVDGLRQDIARAIADARNYREAVDLALAAIDGHADSDALASSVAVPAVMADLAGRLMVFGGTPRVMLARGDDVLTEFLSLPFEEAIEAYKMRVPQSDAELERLLAGYRVRGVQARSMMLETLREKIREHIITDLETGRSFREFQSDVGATIDTLGITPASPAYLETIYRTNVQGAYGAGRWEAIRDPDVVDALPLWQYRAVGDGRTRDSHMALDGMVFEIGNPETDVLAPPGGFNCRCSAVSLADAGGKPIQRSVPAGAQPDPGFGQAPGMWIGPRSV